MVRISAKLALATAALQCVNAAPSVPEKRVTIPVRKGTSGHPITAKDVVDHDLARIASYNGRSHTLAARAASGSAINVDVSYLAAVQICTQTFDLIVDTGSSNIWVGCMSRLCVLLQLTPLCDSGGLWYQALRDLRN